MGWARSQLGKVLVEKREWTWREGERGKERVDDQVRGTKQRVKRED